MSEIIIFMDAFADDVVVQELVFVGALFSEFVQPA